MMTLLSGALSWIVGKGSSIATLPILLLGLVVLGHQYIGERDAKQQAQTTNICDAAWKTAVRQQERDAARSETEVAQATLQGERQITAKLNKDLETLNVLYQDALDRAGTDPRCLSDSVLRSLDDAGPNLSGGGSSGGAQSRLPGSRKK